MLTDSLFAVPGASHEVCVRRISPLVPGGPVHGGLREGKAQGMLGAAHSPSEGAGGSTLHYVKGIVDYYEGSYQIRVFSVNDIVIH